MLFAQLRSRLEEDHLKTTCFQMWERGGQEVESMPCSGVNIERKRGLRGPGFNCLPLIMHMCFLNDEDKTDCLLITVFVK